MAVAAGVPVQLIPDMDDVELATSIRGYELRQTDLQMFLRWMVTALLSPHVKKGSTLKPSDLITLGKEAKSKSNDRKNRLELLKKAMNADKIIKKQE